MSTRGAIMTYNYEGQLGGVYHHQDSHPTTLGSHLIELYHMLNKDVKHLIHAVNLARDWHTMIQWDGNIKNIVYPVQPIFYYTKDGEASAYHDGVRRPINWNDFGYHSAIEYIYIIEPTRLIVLDGKTSLLANPLDFAHSPIALGVIDVYYWGWPKDKLYNNERDNYISWYLPKDLYIRNRATYMKQSHIFWPFRDVHDVIATKNAINPSLAN